MDWRSVLAGGTGRWHSLLLAGLGVWGGYFDDSASSECYCFWLILLFRKEIARKLPGALEIGKSWVQRKNLLKH